MAKRILSYVLLFTLIISFGVLGVSFASEADKLKDVQRNIGNTQQQLNQGKKEENKLLKQVKELESQMVAKQKEIDTLQGSINYTQQRIDTSLAELATLEVQMSEQNDNLNARLRSMYINGNIGFLDVLLGSGSISEFMTNMDRIEMIYESDQAILDDLTQQRLVVDAKKQYLEGLRTDLQQQKSSEAQKKEALKQNQSAIATKKAEVAKDNNALEATLDALNEEADKIVSQIIKLQGGGDYLGGAMGWPVPGVSRITSEFGYRIHPVLKYKKMHTGLDIGAPSGTTVVAANGGTVIMAGWNNSYGNLVMIDHGGGIVTLYAHNSSLLVNTGDVVKRGQAVAKSGSTGMSTGPHVHFEVRVNGEYKNPREWLGI